MRAVVGADVVRQPEAGFVSLPAFPGDKRCERCFDSTKDTPQRIASVVRERQRE